MRVIAGNLKGRNIKAVPGKKTRPTSDKVKEAIFHKLGPFFVGGTCLDLFAGSGALGIEAISRGIEHTTFIDKSSQSIKTIHQNIKQLQVCNQCTVFRNDVLKGIKIIGKKQLQYDLILVDPPYEDVSYEKVLHSIEFYNLLQPGGKLYIESGSIDAVVFNAAYFSILFEKTYSSTTSVMILERKPVTCTKD